MAIDTYHSLLLSSLTEFYKNNPNNRKILYEVVEGKSILSLRILDWFVTHYSNKNNIIFWINENTREILEKYPVNNVNQNTHIKKFNLYVEYRAQLQSYTKMYFDPFRRHERITFILEHDPLVSIVTTVGQLNFFKWAIQNNILTYVENNIQDIEDEMAKYQKDLKNKTKKSFKKNGGTSSTSVIQKNTILKTPTPCYIKFD